MDSHKACAPSRLLSPLWTPMTSRVSRSIANQIHCLSFFSTQTTTFHRTLPLHSALFSHSPSRFLVGLHISCSHTFATRGRIPLQLLQYLLTVTFPIISDQSVVFAPLIFAYSLNALQTAYGNHYIGISLSPLHSCRSLLYDYVDNKDTAFFVVRFG